MGKPTTTAATDTIVAIATPPGRGGIGVVRLSGPRVPAIGAAIIGRLPAPRQAHLTVFRDAGGQSLDQGLALFFPAPHSYTGEDVLELHGHGGPVVMDLLVAAALALGARAARPGEFSERAFLNGKLDLAQAEAVADLIESGSAAAAAAALRSLQGAFSRQVHALADAIADLRTHIEAAIDFPEEEIDFLADQRLAAGFEDLQSRVHALLAGTHQGCLLHDGMTVVLAGRPNAGKSSVLNALAERDSAIVSELPGTTRDVLREQINLDGMPLHVLDTAGLRAPGDVIELEGVRRAHAAIAQADRVLLVVDDSTSDERAIEDLIGQLPRATPYTVVRNKIDLTGRAPHSTPVEVALSARTGAGLDALRAHLKACMGFQPAGAGTFSARRRHVDAIDRAGRALAQGALRLADGQGELAAEELRRAHRALGEITGEFTADDLLGRIFASFCIGK